MDKLYTDVKQDSIKQIWILVDTEEEGLAFLLGNVSSYEDLLFEIDFDNDWDDFIGWGLYRSYSRKKRIYIYDIKKISEQYDKSLLINSIKNTNGVSSITGFNIFYSEEKDFDEAFTNDLFEKIYKIQNK